MNTMTPVRHRAIAIILSSVLAVITLPVVTAADAPTTPPAAEKTAPSLPLTATFAKGTPGEHGGPFSVTLKNTSAKALTVSATIHWSVVSHNTAKQIDLPAHEIAAGGTWTISDLSFDDRVIVTAVGYAPLELKTPAVK